MGNGIDLISYTHLVYNSDYYIVSTEGIFVFKVRIKSVYLKHDPLMVVKKFLDWLRYNWLLRKSVNAYGTSVRVTK